MSRQESDEHIEVNAERARAGQTGLHVRYILTISILLTVIGFLALALYWFV
jgi:diphthamide biosynthesis methyltransferase